MNCSEHFKLAERMLACRNTDQAILHFDLAEKEQHDPDLCSAGRWTCHMLAGNLEFAWRESDLITSRGRPDPHRFWEGRGFAGSRVIIRCLHGLGDTLQFIRYAPLIRQQAESVTIEAQPRLKDLLTRSALADIVITWGEPEPPWDQQIEILELPRSFRTTLETIPNCVPYLSPPKPSMEDVRSSAKVRVGIVWSSGAYNPARSIPLELMGRLCAVEGAHFFSLQAAPEKAQLQEYSIPLVDLDDPSGGILAAAKDLNTLDLVITPDTMMAHLAGALARRVWTLLPFECDWRWMLERDDSPWYPTMRLFRQPSPGDWPSVLKQVRAALEQLIQAGRETVSRAGALAAAGRLSDAPGSVK